MKKPNMLFVGMGLVGCAASCFSAGCDSLAQNPTYRSLVGQTVLGNPQTGPQTGPDILYLTSEASVAPKDTLTAASLLLPMQAGNYWTMQTLVGNARGEETMVVTGSAANAWGETGIGVETRRNGKRFRYEIYKADASGLYLIATQDETSTLMSYSPIIPLVRYPAKEGDTFLWRGQMRMGKETFPATGLSRFSTQEQTKTAAGVFHAFRLDTMVSVSRGGRKFAFPPCAGFPPIPGLYGADTPKKTRPRLPK